MKVKWYEHASFRISSEIGLKIIIDPYEAGGFGGAIEITNRLKLFPSAERSSKNGRCKERRTL